MTKLKTVGAYERFSSEKAILTQASVAWIEARMCKIVLIKRFTFFAKKTFTMNSRIFVRIDYIKIITMLV